MTEAELINSITEDLMKKLAKDVTDSMTRTLSLAGERQRLPIVIAAGASCLGVIAAVLNNAAGGEPGKFDPDCVLLAGLLTARSGIGGEDPVADAYRDFERLKRAEAH